MNRHGRAIGLVALGVPTLTGAVLLVAGGAYSFAALPVVVAPAENPISEAKRVLGKALFWDEQLSIDNTVSCGSCHMAAAGGSDFRVARHPGADGIMPSPDDVFASPGVIASDAGADYEPSALFDLDVQVTSRSAQTAIMAMYAPSLFWDGRAGDAFVDPGTGETLIASGAALETQALGPITSDVEMGHHGRDWDEVSRKIAGAVPLALAEAVPADVAGAIDGAGSYRELFEAAFGDGEVTPARIAFAIATYERTLVPDETPWDRFVAGDTGAMTQSQIQGWNAFRTSRCAACHTPDTFTDHTFRNIALRPGGEDDGRGAITGDAADNGKFKVPTLRNVGLKPTFMHTGQFTNLNQVLAFYRGPGAPGNVRDPLLPVAFPPNVNTQVVDFMQNALTDPRVANEEFPFDRPVLRSELSDGRPVVVAEGRAAGNGRVPRIIANIPGNIGNVGFKLGVENARGGAAATLIFSNEPPVDGELAGEAVATIGLSGTGGGGGYGTGWWPIPANPAFDGRSVYFQWRIADANAVGGAALSEAVRVDLYCGSRCPEGCLADIAEPFGTLSFADITAFLAAFQSRSWAADVAAPFGSLTFSDVSSYLAGFAGGCE